MIPLRTIRFPVMGQLVVLDMPEDLAGPFAAYMVEWGAMMTRRKAGCANPGGVAWAARKRWLAAGSIPLEDRDGIRKWLNFAPALGFLSIDQVEGLATSGTTNYNGTQIDLGLDDLQLANAWDLHFLMAKHGLPDPTGAITMHLRRDALVGLMGAAAFPLVTSRTLMAMQFAAHPDWF